MYSIAIAARDVKVGDKIWNSKAARGWDWVRVKAVSLVDGSIRIVTELWETWKHPAEAIAVHRESAG